MEVEMWREKHLEAFVHSECYAIYPGEKQCFSSTPSFLSSIMRPALMVVSEEGRMRENNGRRSQSRNEIICIHITYFVSPK